MAGPPSGGEGAGCPGPLPTGRPAEPAAPHSTAHQALLDGTRDGRQPVGDGWRPGGLCGGWRSWQQAKCIFLEPGMGATQSAPGGSLGRALCLHPQLAGGCRRPGEKGCRHPLLIPPGAAVLDGTLCARRPHGHSQQPGQSEGGTAASQRTQEPSCGLQRQRLGLSPSLQGAVPPAASWPPGRPAPWLLSSGSEPRTPTCS